MLLRSCQEQEEGLSAGEQSPTMPDKASLQCICDNSHGRCYSLTSAYPVADQHEAHPAVGRLWWTTSLKAAACMSRAGLLLQTLKSALLWNEA